ncbi:MAG: hypothetical protein R3A10_13150 [Caldilineaceae bacterium]
MGAKAFTGVDAMVADAPLDLVVVATPDHLHREPSLAAISAGVPNIVRRSRWPRSRWTQRPSPTPRNSTGHGSSSTMPTGPCPWTWPPTT